MQLDGPTRKMADNIYDMCIIGAGMMGSAAARHATMLPSTRVCLIGPGEPKDKHDNPSGLYGEWFDEGRAYRSTATSPLVAQLSRASIARYREIEQRTGIQFHKEVGSVIVGARDGLSFDRHRRTADLRASELSSWEVHAKFPYFDIGQNNGWLFESRDAGVLNPRKFVRAQQTAAHLQGCDIYDDVASHVTEFSQPDGRTMMKVTTDGDQVVLARKVILATGAFTEFRRLLPEGIRPHMLLDAHTSLYVEVSDAQYQTMRNMPVVSYDCSRTFNSEGDSEQRTVFLLPPLLHPDGSYYIKVSSLASARSLIELDSSNAQQVADWYNSRGSAHEAEWLKECTKKLLPGFHPRSWHTGACVVASTKTGYPYIDLLTSRLGVALGGNGYSAKLCDELGRLAVHLLHQGHWHDKDFSGEDFRFVARFHATSSAAAESVPSAKI